MRSQTSAKVIPNVNDQTGSPQPAPEDYAALSQPSRESGRLTTDWFLVPHEVHRTEIDTLGVFASEPIPAGTICVVLGGFVTPGPAFRTLPESRQRHSIQVGDDLFLVCDDTFDSGDLINHSCDPTLAFIGEITLVARHDIAAGEALTFDYATCDSAPYDEFECACGSMLCRGKVTGEDWMRRDIQERYAGHFAPYLQRRIDALHR